MPHLDITEPENLLAHTGFEPLVRSVRTDPKQSAVTLSEHETE